jgi:hypothetical protein
LDIRTQVHDLAPGQTRRRAKAVCRHSRRLCRWLTWIVWRVGPGRVGAADGVHQLIQLRQEAGPVLRGLAYAHTVEQQRESPLIGTPDEIVAKLQTLRAAG